MRFWIIGLLIFVLVSRGIASGFSVINLPVDIRQEMIGYLGSFKDARSVVLTCRRLREDIQAIYPFFNPHTPEYQVVNSIWRRTQKESRPYFDEAFVKTPAAQTYCRAYVAGLLRLKEVSLNTYQQVLSPAGFLEKIMSVFWIKNDLFFAQYASFSKEIKASSLQLGWPDRTSQKALRVIPPTFCQKTQLKNLSLSGNQLVVLPDLSPLSNLNSLCLQSNALVFLPSLQGLTKLEALDLSNNFLTQLPENLGSLEELKQLYLHKNPWLKFPQSFSRLEKLRKVTLNHCELTFCPSALMLPSLKELLLSHNQLSVLPLEIQQMGSLRYLSLEKNRLTILTSAIKGLTTLEDLDLSHNFLENLPGEIGALTNLKRLWIDHNHLNTYPLLFTRLTSLTFVDARHNKGLTMPPAIKGCLPTLKVTEDHEDETLLGYPGG